MTCSSLLVISSTEAVVSMTATFLVGGELLSGQGVEVDLRRWYRWQPYGLSVSI